MRNTLAVLLASGMLAASASAGFAGCSWGVASKGHDMTVAEAPTVEEEAVTTFDPQVLESDLEATQDVVEAEKAE